MNSTLFYKNGYLTEVSGYEIVLSDYEFRDAKHRIQENSPLIPEFIGMLIGRASPIYHRVVCVVCKKDIKQSEALEQPITNLLEAAHKNCYEEYKNAKT